MSPSSLHSPYPLGTPVRDPRLLQLRRVEIEAALEAVAPGQGTESRHVLLMGEQRSGRTTVLSEVTRRVAADHGRLVVPLCGAAVACRKQLVRQLLIGLVESLAAAKELRMEPWYASWRDRVYLL